MESLKRIIEKRSAPGVLILDLEDRLLFSNEQALEILRLREGLGETVIPAEVFEVCRDLRTSGNGAAAIYGEMMYAREEGSADLQYSLRAFLLGSHGDEGSDHIIVLMEKIIRNRQLDLEHARERFQFSKRETDVVRLICQGLGNKEISGSMLISEFTVKDHLKNIMRKMEVGSRNEIIAALLA